MFDMQGDNINIEISHQACHYFWQLSHRKKYNNLQLDSNLQTKIELCINTKNYSNHYVYLQKIFKVTGANMDTIKCSKYKKENDLVFISIEIDFANRTLIVQV